MSHDSRCSLTTDRFAVLEDLAKAGPMPTVRISKSLVEWFLREGLTRPVSLRSPWSVDNGVNIEHQQITDAGIGLVRLGAAASQYSAAAV